MDILKIADGVTGLFPRKIMVTIVDEVNGVVIGSYKAGKENLPEVFDKPMVIELNGVVWRVVKAEYSNRRNLSLWVQEEGHFRSHNKRWMVPTVAPRPASGGMRIANDFVMEIGLEEWRQVEFLPAEMQEVVEEEMKVIEDTATKGGLLGYETVLMRKNTTLHSVNISFYELFQLLEGKEKGSINLEGVGIVENGFFIRSDEHNFYGIQDGKYIKHLCLQKFDSADDEITKVITHLDLLLADWCSNVII